MQETLKNIPPSHRLKILHIPTSGLNAGGISRFIIDTTSKFDPDGLIESHVLSPFPLKQINTQTIQDANLKLTIIPGRSKNPIAYFGKLLSFLKSEIFDVIHVHGSSALLSLELLAAKLAGIEVRIAHSHNIKCDHPKLHAALLPIFQRLSTHRLACSPSAGQWLFNQEDFTVLYNGIDLEAFQFSLADRQSIRKQLQLEDDYFLLGHIGHFNQQKNHTFLINLFYQVSLNQPKSRLLLIGTGPLEKTIQDKIKELNLVDKVFFLGNVSNPQSYLSAMDYFILPSLFEGFSIVLAEAQANGLPALASDTTPPTVGVTSRIQFLSLNQGPNKWSESLHLPSPQERTLSDDEQASLSVFDIHHIAKSLYDYYLTITSPK